MSKMILVEKFLQLSGKIKLIGNGYKTSVIGNCYKTLVFVKKMIDW